MAPDLVVVLSQTRNPVNIGAAARAMSNFGFTELRLVQAYRHAVDEARGAPGAAGVLLQATDYPGIAEAVHDCSLVVGTTSVRHRQLHLPLQRLETGARAIRQWPGGRVALLFGSEKSGLSNDEMSHCHWLARIPAREQHGSMNLGQAVAICLYELIRGRAGAPRTRSERAAGASVASLNALMEESLTLAGYLRGEAARLKLRRLLRKMVLSPADAENWCGMMRQVLWKLKHPGGRNGA